MKRPAATPFAEWVARNPPPALQDLIYAHGSYWGIPEHAWREYQNKLKAWQQRRQDRYLTGDDNA